MVDTGVADGSVYLRMQALGARCAWAPEGGGTAFTLWLPLRRAAG